MYQQATQAYQQSANTSASADPRALEAEALMKAAARLSVLQREWDTVSREERNETLIFNRTLWTIFVTEATASHSELPLELQNNIANLALFMFNRTMEMMGGAEPEALETMISINKSLAAGLRGQKANI
ncbi:flagellar biosynthesis regulator FlaF [Pseudovibrio denitrificans]|uniref:Flagellar biosynthesis regulator FlaF n=1 Tax=Pseudovibrio brasiliensis TaxID=1898042 RepID=A0ABX8AI49_9HYPH|nr:flagellar biosynthesis regulator FlaF [Pseudovibrio brasiliensis]QUS54755.1 flagellar biosynthesis regulator FlaF [Pseudovibrio brasiliensis]